MERPPTLAPRPAALASPTVTPGKRIVVYGTGSLAEVVCFFLAHESVHSVVATTVDSTHLDEARDLGVPLVPFEEVVVHYPPDGYAMFVAVGYSRMNAVRAERYAKAKELGYELITHVSPRSSTWPDLRVGDNCIVMDGVSIGPRALIGDDCILWTGSYVAHGASIGDHSYVAARAAVSGLAHVGNRSFLGTASIVRDGVSTGERCLVGAGAVVTEDLEDGAVIAPARSRVLPGRSDQLPSF